jgi:hypothetical protein
MTDEEITRFTGLYRKYRADNFLPPDERDEFKRLSAAYRKMQADRESAQRPASET